jgi:hypothetical protein
MVDESPKVGKRIIQVRHEPEARATESVNVRERKCHMIFHPTGHHLFQTLILMFLSTSREINLVELTE